MSFDVAAIRRTNPLAAVIGARVKLTRNGAEQIGLCPFHAEKTPSFTVNDARGFYHCFGCGAHGDVISFVADYHHVDFRAACEILGGTRTLIDATRATPRVMCDPIASPPDDYDGLVAIDPGAAVIESGRPVRCWNPKRPDRPWVTYTPSRVFPYRRADGGLIGYVLRIDLADDASGKARKITPQIRRARVPAAPDTDGETAWTHWPFDKPRPLYRLPELAAAPDHQVLLVEGEKAAEAAAQLLDGLPIVVTTWPGGSKGARHADWSVLRGRSIVLWGDADQPGAEAMLGWRDKSGQTHDGVAQLCHAAGAAAIRIIPWDRSKPRGWDAADAEAVHTKAGAMTRDQVLAWLTLRVETWRPDLQIPTETSDDTVPRPTGKTAAAARDPAPDVVADEPPFRILGYNKGSYYYYPRASRQVVALTAAAHSKAHLLTLAPLAYWARQYPGRNGFDLDAATDALIAGAHRIGLFTPDRLRGRGAWRDRIQGSPRIVVHTGHRAYIDGRAHDPAEIEGDYIYEAAPAMIALNHAPSPAEPATTAEANRLVQLCQRLTWENALSGDLLAGWCVIAPICGVLAWRPHIWITGPAQAGKSTVVKDIIGRVIGPFALYMDGKTTEAGIRQLLGADARPVILDEVESEDMQAAQRVQHILDMARVSSSGGTVVKGSTGGKPLTYTLRACFCFSSINTAVAHYADETRISKLVLRRNEAPDADRHYRDLTTDIEVWLTPDYAARLLARAIAYIDVLLENAETFKNVAARLLQSRRAADQIGNMLAGLYLCYSSKAINAAEAEDWIRRRDWHDHTAIDAAGDETRLLERLATRRLRVSGASGLREVTVGQAVIAVHGNPDSYADWAAELGANGFKIDGDDLLIANNASPLKKMLEGTPWSADWLRPLRLLPGASAAPNTYFSPGLKSRATRLPVRLLGVE